jgi:cytochrome b subunit of formate dehydrogenase
MGDSLNTLPVDQIPLKEDEKQITDILFKEKESTFQKYWQLSKIYILSALLVFIILLPITDKVMFKIWGKDDSKMISALLKTFIFLILLIILTQLTK